MSLHKIEKQYLLGAAFSPNALSLARAIYNTYIEDNKNLYMNIKLSKIQMFLNLSPHCDSTKQIIRVLEEINEPIGVRNFKFYAQEYPIRFLKFCSYKIDEENIEIHLNEEFLYAEELYMIDKFLTN